MTTSQKSALGHLFNNENNRAAAEQLDADISLDLTQEQRNQLLKYIETHKRFPTAIGLTVGSDTVASAVEHSALFPVTVLVGAMT